MTIGDITVAVADDHPIVRRGVRDVLEAEKGLRVIGEAGDGPATVEMVGQLHPDVLLVDLAMRGLPGLEVIRRLKQQSPQTRCIVFSPHSGDSYIREAFQSGAWGYLHKGDNPDEMVRAARTVMLGKRYLCPTIAKRASANALPLCPERRDASLTRDAYSDLSEREREVFQGVAEGETNTAIAERLVISVRTVEVHRANAMRKLNLRNQSEVVRYAVRRGLISLN